MSNFNVTHNIDFGIQLRVQQKHLARNAKEADKKVSGTHYLVVLSSRSDVVRNLIYVLWLSRL